eukprot:8463686-Pyramimonas_sp.AAC.1
MRRRMRSRKRMMNTMMNNGCEARSASLGARLPRRPMHLRARRAATGASLALSPRRSGWR